jgi:hypothetical protein
MCGSRNNLDSLPVKPVVARADYRIGALFFFWMNRSHPCEEDTMRAMSVMAELL